MTFTDDDLKRLKENQCAVKDCVGVGRLSCRDLDALLARLEAAEAIVERWDKDILVEKALFETWRKAKGTL